MQRLDNLRLKGLELAMSTPPPGVLHLRYEVGRA
jgi:hypothetical protein